MSDRRSVQRPTPAERSFLAQIYDSLHLPMLVYARKMLGDEGWAEDVVHDVFLGIVKNGAGKLCRMASDDERRAYLLVSVRNRCRSYLRKKQSEGLLLTPETARFAETGPASQGEENADEEAIIEAIRSLGETYADVLFYALVAELPAPEIAALLGLTPAAVRKRISRGKEKLREILEKENT